MALAKEYGHDTLSILAELFAHSRINPSVIFVTQERGRLQHYQAKSVVTTYLYRSQADIQLLLNRWHKG